MDSRVRIERDEKEKIEKTLKVSSYMDDILTGIATGDPVRAKVPDLRNPSFAYGNETDGFSLAGGVATDKEMVTNAMVDIAMSTLGNNYQTPQQESLAVHKQASSSPRNQRNALTLTRNQAKAVMKYPSIVEFLGQEEGERVAQQISAEINKVIASKVERNSQELSKFAAVCTAEKQYIKQYFRGDQDRMQWVCCVTARGPFTGQEAIFYSFDKDMAFVLKRNGDEYADVSKEFNFTHESASENAT